MGHLVVETPKSIWIGFDPREASAFAVARHSIKRHLTQPIPVCGLVLGDLQAKGLYNRPIAWHHSVVDKPIMWDVISDAPMSTQHANARFLVPFLSRMSTRVAFTAVGDGITRYAEGSPGWALFLDGDVLVRGNLARLFEKLDPSKAVYCVQHRYEPMPGVKMDSQIQTNYARKNWSSFCLWNIGHPGNKRLTLEMVNTLPGRDLHRFCWLRDWEIGELDPKYNFLVGQSDPEIDPVVVHFTEGVPDMKGYENVPYADEWRAELEHWAA